MVYLLTSTVPQKSTKCNVGKYKIYQSLGDATSDLKISSWSIFCCNSPRPSADGNILTFGNFSVSTESLAVTPWTPGEKGERPLPQSGGLDWQTRHEGGLKKSFVNWKVEGDWIAWKCAGRWYKMALVKQTYIDLNMGCHLKGKKRSRNHCFLSSVPDCHGT